MTAGTAGGFVMVPRHSPFGAACGCLQC